MISQGPIDDRLAIRELVESYNDAVMRFDATAWAANWTEDSHWIRSMGEAHGKADIVASWQQAMANFSFVGFFASAGPIIVDGDLAQGTWFQQEFLHAKDGSRRNVTGRYEDDYVRQDGRWYFRQRVYTVLHAELIPAPQAQ